jgi:hypothetical protein
MYSLLQKEKSTLSYQLANLTWRVKRDPTLKPIFQDPEFEIEGLEIPQLETHSEVKSEAPFVVPLSEFQTLRPITKEYAQEIGKKLPLLQQLP